MSHDVSTELTAAIERFDPGLLDRMTGVARQALWQARDGWIVGYTTTRIEGGGFHGKFAVMAYKPVGKGSRSGGAEEFTRVYYRPFATRKAARARAVALYQRHDT